MATFVINSDEQSRFGYSRESAFGTAIADSGAFTEIFPTKGIFIDLAVKKTDLNLNRATRILNLDDVFVDTFTGPVVLTIPELIVSYTTTSVSPWVDFIYSVFQNRTSQGTTPFQKVFNWSASQPDYIANAGMFFTLGWRGPVASKHIKVTSCIIRKLTIEIDKSGTGDNNLVKFKNVEIIGKKLAQGSNFTGTWTSGGTTRFSPHSFIYTDITASSTAIPFMKFALTLDNGAVPIDRDSDGTPHSYFLNPSKLGAMTAEVTHWYNADTTGTIRDFLAGEIANTQINSKISSGSTGVDGFFDINFKGVIDNAPQGAENRQLTVPIKWILGNTGSSTTDGLTITVTDTINQTL